MGAGAPRTRAAEGSRGSYILYVRTGDLWWLLGRKPRGRNAFLLLDMHCTLFVVRISSCFLFLPFIFPRFCQKLIDVKFVIDCRRFDYNFQLISKKNLRQRQIEHFLDLLHERFKRKFMNWQISEPLCAVLLIHLCIFFSEIETLINFFLFIVFSIKTLVQVCCNL